MQQPHDDQPTDLADLWDLPNPLASAGLTSQIEEQLQPLLTGERFPARVARIEYGGLHLVTPDGRQPAVARLNREHDESRVATQLAVGDWVAAEPDKSEDRLLVTAVAPRHGTIARRDPSQELLEQVLAANVESVLVVQALDRPLRPGRIERSLVLAHEGGVRPIVVATKSDLDLPEVLAEVREATPPDTEFIALSAQDGSGFDQLVHLLPEHGTAALIGESGAGKSSLVNELLGRQVLATGSVRGSDAKGRHTTTARELVPLGEGVCLLDMPGTRELGLVRDTGGIAAAFSDIYELAQSCRFADCRHEKEAGCAILAAIAEGEMSDGRRQRYVDLRTEVEELDHKRELRVRRLGEGRRPERGFSQR